MGMGWKGNRIRQEMGVYTSWITLVATVENLLFTFFLLNGGVPDVETIYFVSTKQKKELFTEITRFVSDIILSIFSCLC